MGKLPKSMQKHRRDLKSLRSQGSANVGGPKHVSKGVNRQMRRRMQQKGLDGMEEIPAMRVIIQTGEDEDLVIESPQVIKVNQQGMEVYQVVGSANSIPANSFSTNNQPIEDAQVMEDSSVSNDMNINEEITTQITEQDIQLVAMQTGVSPEIAENALKESKGDLAKAIINLKTQ
ncbi:MAG: nascent polypeptide-associated complex protein [Promethearchaeota archaeon]